MERGTSTPRLLGIFGALILAAFVAWTVLSAAQEASPSLAIEGVINPVTARYLTANLSEAAEQDAPFVVVRLDTPGGTMEAMRRMVQAVLGSPVPVIIYVAPPGARAASAGMFLTAAAHVAAMAPGTNLGAAHPVSLGQQGEQDSVISEKVVSDAAALVRAIAEARGRNAAWLEKAVRQSVSLTATEALQENVIDLVAANEADLLQKLHGREVETRRGLVTLKTEEVRLEPKPMGIIDRFLHLITDPNIAYVLFMLGLIGLAAELYSPGAFFPGIVGAIALILAFLAFGTLPINWAGILLLVLGVGLLVAELMVSGTGFLLAGGLGAFILGSLVLYRPFGPVDPSLPALRISWWVVASVAALMTGFFLVVVRALWQSRRAPVRTGSAVLVGKQGVALSPLNPQGQVRVDGEVWTAIAEPESIEPGAHVLVLGVEGVTLRVIGEASSDGGKEGES
jgi:membrane-bound serine protease (ClpP class)